MQSSGEKELISVKQKVFSRFYTLSTVSISNTVGCLRFSAVSHAVALTMKVIKINDKRLHEQVKDLYLGERCKAGVSNSNCSVGHMRTYKVTANRIMTLTQQ